MRTLKLTEKIFHPIYGTPMDELFSRYMYYERALKEIKSSTTEALRKFYERDNYKLLQSTVTLENLKMLAAFWNDVSNQNKERFSENVLRRLYVFEFKLNGTAEQDLQQIDEKGYLIPYQTAGREVVKVGVEFSGNIFPFHRAVSH